LVGVAEKVTFVPLQTVLPGLAAMLTAGVAFGTIVTVMLFDVAVAGFAQPSEEVRTQLITSWSFSELFA
jgi:hypothetical protein